MAAKVEQTTEDVVEYRLFPLIPESYLPNSSEHYLEEQLDNYLAFMSRQLVGYIWQKEPFKLRVVQGSMSGSVPPHLYGSTNYGDNVEDEWFITHLMFQLTAAFSGLVVKIIDTDGEFLLIEAANSLPKWLNPETSDNRVYIYDGKVHIIPRPQSPAEVTTLPGGTPNMADAVNCVREHASITLASDKIQKDIAQRVGDFPGKIAEMTHRAHCYIPAALAAVLDHTPSLVAPMVQSFYYRDPTDLKCCITMKHFRPGTRVLREVKFTKCLYAQLMQQQFIPDKRSGWTMPATSNPKYKSHDLGMKLAHGAEILCSQCQGSQPDGQDINALNQHNSRWTRFLATLTDKGYFRGEIEGSKLYIKLLDEAKKFFQQSVIPTNRLSEQSPGQQVLDILNIVTFDLEEMRQAESELTPPDDDGWLQLSSEQLDEMLNKASGNVSSPDSFDLSQMTDSMRSFMDKMSTHEGAEVPGNRESAEIQFDPNSFMQSMQKMFEFEDPDSASSSDMSEYGSDESEDELSSKRRPTKKHAKETDIGGYLGMKDYMDIMDRELAKTNVGQSFVREETEPTKPAPAHPPAPERPKTKPPPVPERPSVLQPQEAPPRPVAPPRKKKKKPAPKAQLDDMDDIDDLDDDDFKPVNVDLNMVKNLLESYSSQEGAAGPTSNILGSMGVKIPKDSGKK